jgi:cytochrome c-type biogenesis protein CcmH/NrfF
MQLYRYFVSQYSQFCCHNPLCSFSTSIVVVIIIIVIIIGGGVYFVLGSVRKLWIYPHMATLFTVVLSRVGRGFTMGLRSPTKMSDRIRNFRS